MFDHVGDAGRLEGVVADGTDNGKDVPFRIAEMGRHLSSARLRFVLAKQAVKERLGRHPACQQERFIAVMGVKPIVRREMKRQRRGRLVTGPGNVKKRLAAAGQLFFEPINFS